MTPGSMLMIWPMLALGVRVWMKAWPMMAWSLASFTWVARPPTDTGAREPVTMISCT